MSERSVRNYRLITWPALAVVFLDQLSKLVIVKTLEMHESVPIIIGFFNLVHVRNRGMAFGLMNRSEIDFTFYFLVAASCAAIVLLLLWFFSLKEGKSKLAPGLSLILGGAIGNLIDRIRLHEVVDFLDFYIGRYHWPAFNFADSAITVGTFWVFMCLIFKHKRYKI